MTARERLAGLLAPDVLAALEELVDERVAERLDGLDGNGGGSPWLSIEAGAGYLGVSPRTLERAIARGRLESTTVGRRRLVHRDELDAYAKDGRGGEAPATPPSRPRRV